ncbi:MAG: hypothetical protein LBT40_05440 [Deltaproteobacteria bacterium]|jgi:type IV pilus assembly protein PilY1|nr:hypothetical protein [Deltaproteobacteria bacterium]
MTTSRVGRWGRAAVAAAILAAWAALFTAPEANGANVMKSRYSVTPFMTLSRGITHVLVIVSKDHKMYRQAYNNMSDLDGDGKMDFGFDPSRTYYGLHDPQACYRYLRGSFERESWTDKKHKEALNPTRPPELSDRMDIDVPRSANGVCTAATRDGNGLWHGNWLNWFLTSHMDAVRKALYGGKRYSDHLRYTVLEHSYLAKDAHLWGAQVVSDDLWGEKMKVSPYYDVSMYTGFVKPDKGKIYYFARDQKQVGDWQTAVPILLVETNIDARFRHKSAQRDVGLWDFVASEPVIPNSSGLNIGHKGYSFDARVKVCDPDAPGGISPRDNCLEYAVNAWKPSGIFQEYGADRGISFGLMTGVADEKWRKIGGVVRRHVENLANSYDFINGLKRSMGMLSFFDQLHLTGWTGKNYKNNSAWGSPLGEMLYESVRYFSGAKKSSCPLVQGEEISPWQFDWERNRPKDIFYRECAFPVTIVIGSAYPDYDTDDIPSPAEPEIAALKPISYLRNPNGTVASTFDKNAYLDAITKLEGFTDAGKKFYYSRNESDDCTAKPLVSLSEVKGLCPEEPSLEGGYSLAAVAWFARTHSLSASQNGNIPMILYTVALPSNFPVIKFDLGNGRLITAMPFSESAGSRLILPLSYFVVDWQTDSTGLPFYVKIVAAFDSAIEGGTYSRKALGTYEFALLTTKQGNGGSGGSPAVQLEPVPLRIHAGALKDPLPDPALNPFGKTDLPQTYYRFRNYATDSGAMNYRLPKITIDRSKVTGFAVTTDAYGSTSKESQLVGYAVTGTEADGTYMDVSHSGKNAGVKATVDWDNPWPNLQGVPTNFTSSDSLLKQRSSPWKCLVPGGSGCGSSAGGEMTYYMTRGFRLSPDGAGGQFIPDPMWLAAKYGAFNDYNRNGVPDRGEWERDPEHPVLGPANYFAIPDPANMAAKFDAIFRDVQRNQGYNTGSASHIVGDEGGGLSIQSIYYPRYLMYQETDKYVSFVGSVYGLFIDRYGNLREDSDQDGKLTLKTEYGNGDRIVTFTTTTQKPEIEPRCWSALHHITVCDDPTGTNQPTVTSYFNAHPPNPHELNAVWDAGRWLLELQSDDDRGFRADARAWTSPATFTQGRRRIYFGYRDQGKRTSMLLFDLKTSRRQLETMLLHDNFRDYFPSSTDSRPTAVEELVSWVVGRDYPHLRNRKVVSPWYIRQAGRWILGDVINSKPIAVEVPKSNFDVLYNDQSYAKFKKENVNRRIMVYFGANDGMLHAVNGGFATGKGEEIGYSTASKTDPGALKHDLGAELWAYIPEAAMPTLPFLADPGYIHNYFVDLKPLLVDIKLRDEWRTVLIGGMRMGGRPVEAGSSDLNKGYPYFSDVFCLDVTDPEKEPVFMWSYSSIELGLMVGTPVTVRSGGKFYVMLPSGPVTDSVRAVSESEYQLDFGGRTPYQGVSRQNARVIVLDAETGRPVIDPARNPDYLTASVPESFFSSPFLPKANPKIRGEWSDHAVYLGLTETSLHGNGHDEGSLWRVQMIDSLGDPIPPAEWKLRRLLDTHRPITGAVNSTRDADKNVWVIFGTGRLFDQDDLTPCDITPSDECLENHDQYMYGLKEPLNSRGVMTFEDLTDRSSGIVDMSGAMVLRTGEVVNLTSQSGVGTVAGMTSFVSLENVMRGSSSVGWKKKLDSMQLKKGVSGRNFEMVVTQPKLMTLGGGKSLMAVTSFQPGLDICSGYGDGFLHLVDAFTGLPRPETHSTFASPGKHLGLPDGVVSGVVMLGVGSPTEAVIIQSSGRTIIRATASDGGVTDLEFPNTPGTVKTAILLWREVTDTGFSLSRDAMVLGLEDK